MRARVHDERPDFLRWFVAERYMKQKLQESSLRMRRRADGGQMPRLRICLILAAFMACFTTASLAQKQAQPAESALMRQLHQALGLAQHGDEHQALALTNHLLEQDPDFVPALKLQGMLLEDAGRPVEAAQSYQKGLRLAPNDADLLFKVGVYQLVAGDKDRAIILLLHHLRLEPKDGDAFYYLAQAYHLNDKDDLALQAIRQCLKAEPDNPSVVQKYGELLSSSGNYQEGLRWLLKAQQADAKLPLLDYEIGVADYKLMDIDSAARSLTRAVEAHPDDVNALELLAAAQTKLGHWPQAKDAFARLVAYKPDDVKSLLGLGHCQVEMRDYAAAVDTLDAVLRLDPTRLLAHFYLSRAYAGMGRTADAEHEAALHHLMMDQESFVRAEENAQREEAIKAQARQMLAELHEADALKLYREHFKGSSATDADAYVFVGKLYLFMGKTEDGLRCLHHALQLQPTVRGAHTDEGILALKLGDLDRAEKEFKAELANDPNYQMAIAEMGEVRYRQGRWPEAAELLARSRTMTPELLYMLCDAYFHQGKVMEANLNAEVAAAYGRNNPDLMTELLDLLKRNGQAELAGRLSANMKP